LYLTRLYDVSDGEEFQSVIDRCFAVSNNKHAPVRTGANLKRVKRMKMIDVN
jgi:hypothetical protein